MFGFLVAVIAISESTILTTQDRMINLAGSDDFKRLAGFFDSDELKVAEVLKCIANADRRFGRNKVCLTVPMEELAGIPGRAETGNAEFMDIMEDTEKEQGQQCERFTGDFAEFNNRNLFARLSTNIENRKGIRFTYKGKTVKLRKNRSLNKRGYGALCWAALTTVGIYAGLVAMIVIGALVLSGTAVGTLSHGGAIALVVVGAVFLSGGISFHIKSRK